MSDLIALHIKFQGVNILKAHVPMNSGKLNRKEEEPGDEESPAWGKAHGGHRTLASRKMGGAESDYVARGDSALSCCLASARVSTICCWQWSLEGAASVPTGHCVPRE